MARSESIGLKRNGLTMHHKIDVVRHRMKVDGRYRHPRGTGDGYMWLGTEMRALREGEGIEWHGRKAISDQNLWLGEAPVIDVKTAACGDGRGEGRLT